MKTLRASLTGILIATVVMPLAAITITQPNVSILEDFDTLATSTGSVVPEGWQFIEVGTGANATYGAGTGSSSLGNTYSFGAVDSTDRAFGSVRTASVAATIGTVITNETGATITDLKIDLTGEQWRLGALSRVDQLDFGYSIDATSVDTGSWLDVDALDVVGPVTTGTTGALDGNAAGNQIMISHTLSGLSLASGSSLWLRWVDFDASGSDDGLAIDNFSITALQTGTPDDGGGPVENVPDQLPLPLVTSVIAGLLARAASHRRDCAP